MGCPVFIAPGNHDPYVRTSPYMESDWPDNVHIFSTEDLQKVEVDRLGCVVHGAAFTDSHRVSEALATFINSDSVPLNADGITAGSRNGKSAEYQI